MLYIEFYDLNWITHILMLLIGISEGYIFYMTYAMAPQFVAKYKREATMSILRFFHFVGMAVGSIIAVIVLYIVKYTCD